MNYDIIIKNGTVFDGKGAGPVQADIGIVADEIETVGNLQEETAGKIIDANGKYVTPGFIDLANHSDTHWTIFSDPSQESLLRQGVTTILGGNCGSSLAPYVGDATAEDIGRWSDITKMNINWNTVGEFLDELDKHKIGVNFATLVGFNTLQRAVFGKEIKSPDEKEHNQMKLLLKEALQEGAYGLSTNFGISHVRSKDDNELVDLFSLIKKNDALIKHHLEDEGANVLPALSRLISIAKRSDTKTHITHFKTLGKKSWGFFASAITMVKNAIAEKIKITCDFYPYTKTGSNLLTLLPLWFRNLPMEDKKIILSLKEDARRKELLGHLRDLTLHYDRIIIASGGKLGETGKTIEELSKRSGLSGEELILNLLEISDLRTSIFNEVILGDNIELIAKEDFSAISSDGVGYDLSRYDSGDMPHPRSFGAFPRAMGLLVRDNPVLEWQNFIYKATGFPAKILGLDDRGVLAKGKKADIIIFDPKEIKDFATYENSLQYSRGISEVLVNGKIAVNNGEFTDELAGRVLRRR